MTDTQYEYGPYRFEWDLNKSDKTKNAPERDFSFEYAARVFLDKNRIDWVDERKNYGEKRNA